MHAVVLTHAVISNHLLQMCCCPGTTGSWSGAWRRAAGPSPSCPPFPSSLRLWRWAGPGVLHFWSAEVVAGVHVCGGGLGWAELSGAAAGLTRC